MDCRYLLYWLVLFLTVSESAAQEPPPPPVPIINQPIDFSTVPTIKTPTGVTESTKNTLPCKFGDQKMPLPPSDWTLAMPPPPIIPPDPNRAIPNTSNLIQQTNFTNNQFSTGQSLPPLPGSATVLPGDEVAPNSQSPVINPNEISPENQTPPPPEEISIIGLPKPRGRVWYDVELLFWMVKPTNSPSLLGIYPANNINTALFGQSIFPSGNISYHPFTGLRQTFGGWLTPDRQWGLEFSFFETDQPIEKVSYLSPSNAILGRPFYDVNQQAPSYLALSEPGQSVGIADIRQGIQLNGFDLNLFRPDTHLLSQLGWDLTRTHFDWLLGVRSLRLWETLQISETTIIPSSGTQIDSFDSFTTRNHFWGGQIGGRLGYASERWSATAIGKVSYGVMNEEVSILGLSNLSVNGSAVSAANGGVLAQPSNMGDHSRNITAVVPELIFRTGYRLRPNMVIFVGYDFLWISNVARTGRQIDPNLSPNQVPFIGSGTANGIERPLVVIRGDSFWAQAFSLGFSLTY